MIGGAGRGDFLAGGGFGKPGLRQIGIEAQGLIEGLVDACRQLRQGRLGREIAGIHAHQRGKCGPALLLLGAGEVIGGLGVLDLGFGLRDIGFGQLAGLATSMDLIQRGAHPGQIPCADGKRAGVAPNVAIGGDGRQQQIALAGL